MDQPAKESAGCQHNRAGVMRLSRLINNTAANTLPDQQIADGRFNHFNTGLRDKPLHGIAVQRPVSLGPGAMDGRSA